MTEEEKFARRLRELAYNQNLTVKQLASKMDMSLGTVYDWLNGKRIPRSCQLPKLRKVLGCQWEELMGYED